MKSLFKYLILVFAILLGISGLAAFFGSSVEQPEQVPLSEIVTQINQGMVQEITVAGDRLEVTLLNEERIESKKEPGVSTFETLLNLGATNEKLSQVNIEVKEDNSAGAILSLILPILLPLILFVGIFWFMFRQAQRGSMQAMTFTKSKAKLANKDLEGKKITFKEVAGLLEAKEEIEEVVQFLKSPQKFHKLGARIPRGILLVGAPGTGKTLLARAVANEADAPFYYVSGSDFVELFVGVGANRVRDMFAMAKKDSPSIVFIDEIDAVGRQRGAGLGGGHDEREQTLNQILVEMDGFETDDNTIVMAATNRPDILDPALLRPGRFDRRVVLDLPSIDDRRAILNLHTKNKPLAEDADLQVIAERTPGFSGADLANLVNEAAILAGRENQKEIVQDNLASAIEKVMLGPERKSHALNKKEKDTIAYHEAGHALVAASLPDTTDPVHKVSIVSRGKAGGYTLKLPSEDKHLRTKREFESELSVLMGGYVAEKLVNKDVTTGAANDLKVASELARQMITQYGMSEKLGPVTFGSQTESIFLGRELSSHKNYSEKVASEIDAEIKSLVSNAYKKTEKILSSKIKTLHKLAKELIKKETLEKEEFYALLD
jgi:cell division protease FtsH